MLEVLEVTEPEAGMPIVMNALIDLCVPARTHAHMGVCAHESETLSGGRRRTVA